MDIEFMFYCFLLIAGLSGVFICLSILRHRHDFWLFKWRGHSKVLEDRDGYSV